MAEIAIVTGAASGIGLSSARRLRDEGLDVVAVDLPGPRLDAVAALGFRTVGADLSVVADRDLVVQAGVNARALVNSAGIIRLKPILEVTVEDIKAIYSVNFDAVWDLTSRIGRTMSRGGSIVNISSVAAKLAITTEAAVYASSKAAVLSLTRSFAYEFASKGVRVNAICPGFVDTPMLDELLVKTAAARGISVEEYAEARIASVPMGRACSPDECANLTWFLLSDQSSYMTGQSVNFTGGMIMQ
jgi:NAD(P)-dependent dehydrogenase (short-subunit alcohol dehydrogenase family)